MSVDNLNAEVISCLEKSGQALGEAEALNNQVLAETEKIASMVPAVAAELVRDGLLSQDEVPAFTVKLASHEGTLHLVRKMAKLIVDGRREMAKEAAASPGSAVDSMTLTAPAVASAGCFVGQRVGLGQRDNAKYASEVALGLSPV